MRHKIQSIMLLLSIVLFFGCEGDSVQQIQVKDKGKEKKYEGYIIDSPVVNLTYQCDNKFFKTEEKGYFSCTSLPVKLFVAGLKLGEISIISTDEKVYVQDILKKSRDNFTDSEVIKIAILLQSLDSDNNSSNGINIDEAVKFNTVKNLAELSLQDVKDLLIENKIEPVSEEAAEQHLREFGETDTVKPVIKLLGKKTINILEGSEYNDAGAVVTDNRDKDIELEVSGAVNSDEIGTYLLKYNATDEAENSAIQVVRTVNVRTT